MALSIDKHPEDAKHKTLDKVFKVIFVVIGLAIVWLFPLSLPYKLTLTAIVLFISIRILQAMYDPKRIEWTIRHWVMVLSIGILLVVVSIWIEPVWGRTIILLFKGQYPAARNELLSQPHANVILFAGLCVCYGAFAGMARLLVLRILRKGFRF